MAIIIYLISFVLLILISNKIGKGSYLRHAGYTKMIYPAVYMFFETVFNKDRQKTGGILIMLYGSRHMESLYNLSSAVKFSSFIIFSAFPVVFSFFSKPGTLETILSYMFPVAGYFLPDIDLKSRIKKRRISILTDYPVFCMNLAIMMGAGLNILQSWEKAANKDSDSIFYREARFVILKMKTGMIFSETLYEFSGRIGLPEIHTFVSVINQGIKTGGSDLSDVIRNCAKQSWVERENRAKKRGEEASSKLVFPLALGLAGIIVILAAPAVILMKGM